MSPNPIGTKDPEPDVPPVPPAPPDGRSLDRSLVQGVAWTSGIKWGVQILTWAITILVMRLLTPEDYGLVGMAGLFLGLVTLVSEFGLGSAVVALRNLSDDHIAQLNSVAVIVGFVALLVSAAAAWPVADFFNSPRLPPVILALSTTFVISALTVVPSGILRRDLEYRTLAMVEAGQAIADVSVTLLLAWLGLGYWSLVLGRLAKFVVGAVALWVVAPQRFAVPRVREIRHALTFSFHVIAGRIGWYTYSNADYLIVGKVLGQAPLGLYNAAFSLSRMPADKITGMVTRVSPGIFSAVQDDPKQLRRYVVLLTEGLALVTFPPLIGLGLVAPEAIRVMLGARWLGAITPLQILSIGAAMNAVTPILPQVLQVVGETRYSMQVTLAAAVIFVAGFLVGIHWGVTGVAVAWVILHPTAVVVPVLLRVRRSVGLSVGSYAAALWPAVSGCLVMAAAVLPVRTFVGRFAPTSGVLVAEVAAGGLAYLAMVFTVHRGRTERFFRAVRLLRG